MPGVRSNSMYKVTAVGRRYIISIRVLNLNFLTPSLATNVYSFFLSSYAALLCYMLLRYPQMILRENIVRLPRRISCRRL
jgi:hypothetical protein